MRSPSLNFLSFAAIGLLVLGISSLGKADFKGTVFEDKKATKKIFTVENTTVESDAKVVSTTTYTDPEGKVMVVERGEYQVGVPAEKALIRLEVDHQQTSQKGSIEVKEGKIFFSVPSKGGSGSKKEDLKDGFVVSSTFQLFLRQNWEKLMKGETLKFRFGSWERMETVRFEVSKTAGGGEAEVELTMKPASFIIAAFVNPMKFRFAPDGSKLLRWEGRVPPKASSGPGWKDLEATIIYE